MRKLLFVGKPYGHGERTTTRLADVLEIRAFVCLEGGIHRVGRYDGREQRRVRDFALYQIAYRDLVLAYPAADRRRDARVGEVEPRRVPGGLIGAYLRLELTHLGRGIVVLAP